MSLQVLGDRVILKKIEKEQKSSLIINPHADDGDRIQKARVLSIGKNSQLKEDDVVFFDKYSSQEIKIHEVDYLIIKESEILAKE